MSNTLIKNKYIQDLSIFKMLPKNCEKSQNYECFYTKNENLLKNKYQIIDYNYQNKEYYQIEKKKVVFAHMVNTIEAVDWAMRIGANGLEMDLRFNPETNIPTEFRHSTFNATDVCDCSIGYENRDTVCNYLNNHIGSNKCTTSENAGKMLRHLAKNYTDKLAVLYVDSKVDKEDKPKNLKEAGKRVIDLLENELFLNGYKGQVIISAGEVEYAEYIKSAIESSEKTNNKEKYYFAYDGQSSSPNILPRSGVAKEEFRKSIQGLINANTKNRVYSAGITALLPGKFYDQISLAVYNKKIGVISSVGIWTLDDPDSMRKYLNFGVDGIVTNIPSEALKVIRENGFSLALPGEALQPGTSDILITELPAGEVCESNSNCRSNACARGTAEYNALKICCPSGKFGTYAGYDYCYGMADGKPCWSDAMCESRYCRGNNAGLTKGICGKLEVGQNCDINANCKNGNCARESANDGVPKVCCKSGRSGRYAGYDYCYDMKRGTRCWSDAMCASGNCKGNMSGLQRGNCT